MRLVRPEARYLQSYAEAIAKDAAHRPGAEQIFSDPASVIKRSIAFERGIGLKIGYVPQTTFWLVDGDLFIGQIDVRHRLTPSLLQYGGHIGYEVRWSQCRRGNGTRMLSLALPYCRDELGLRRVLITCDDDNAGSAGVIENNGGILENRVINRLERGVVTTRRYWIAL